jgi:hypothetical protein
MIKAFVLTSHKHLELNLNLTPPPLTQLCHTKTLAHVGEYIQIVRALTLSTPTTPFDETTRILHLLYPLAKVDLPPFVDDFHPKTEVILNQEAFIMLWLVHHVFILMALWVWCMNFYKISLSQMIL